jgi:hypothetical protein
MTLANYPVGNTLECPGPRRSYCASPGAIYTGTLELHYHIGVDVLLVLAEIRNRIPLA